MKIQRGIRRVAREFGGVGPTPETEILPGVQMVTALTPDDEWPVWGVALNLIVGAGQFGSAGLLNGRSDLELLGFSVQNNSPTVTTAWLLYTPRALGEAPDSVSRVELSPQLRPETLIGSTVGIAGLSLVGPSISGYLVTLGPQAGIEVAFPDPWTIAEGVELWLRCGTSNVSFLASFRYRELARRTLG